MSILNSHDPHSQSILLHLTTPCGPKLARHAVVPHQYYIRPNNLGKKLSHYTNGCVTDERTLTHK